MAELMPQAELRVVPGGHGLPLENPAAIVDALA
jgi:pimeloyl-ACP methyl ester carboxylesterase